MTVLLPKLRSFEVDSVFPSLGRGEDLFCWSAGILDSIEGFDRYLSYKKYRIKALALCSMFSNEEGCVRRYGN